MDPNQSVRGVEGVSTLLKRWQSTADESCFETLVGVVRPIVEETALRTLRSAHVADPSAVDDCVAMVLDHLRRLPGAGPGERSVAPFRSIGSDSGVGFVRWLAKERARDVARARRRRTRLTMTFSQLDPSESARLEQRPAEPGASRPEITRMHRAIAALDARTRDVLARLLDGESQAVIARSMGVSEGTVSRIRTKAIEDVRRLFAIDRPRPR
jgi:RNA polymerase sigma factor (sigma-70 family)